MQKIVHDSLYIENSTQQSDFQGGSVAQYIIYTK